MSIKLIVNADDYGHTAGISAGIREAHLKGIVTSTSAMMNRPSAPQALLDAANLCPNLGIGVHLVLTSGQPLSNPIKIPSLVTPEGVFRREEAFIAALPLLDPAHVWTEWNAQVAKFVEITGRAPDHLDSHHHSSYFTPDLFEMMLQLAMELGCAIRRPNWPDPHEADLPAPFTPESILEMQDLIAKYQPRTTAGFCGDFYDEGVTLEHLLQVLADVAAGTYGETAEIMSHPAVVDDELRATSIYNDMRARERELLQAPEVLSFKQSHGIELINFSKL
jgi:hypothetical protein